MVNGCLPDFCAGAEGPSQSPRSPWVMSSLGYDSQAFKIRFGHGPFLLPNDVPSSKSSPGPVSLRWIVSSPP